MKFSYARRTKNVPRNLTGAFGTGNIAHCYDSFSPIAAGAPVDTSALAL